MPVFCGRRTFSVWYGLYPPGSCGGALLGIGSTHCGLCSVGNDGNKRGDSARTVRSLRALWVAGHDRDDPIGGARFRWRGGFYRTNAAQVVPPPKNVTNDILFSSGKKEYVSDKRKKSFLFPISIGWGVLGTWAFAGIDVI